ncbi:MAG: cytochrome c maturation protein CcmE [Rhodospirillaceae bacterium]
MTRKRRRLTVVMLAGLLLATATALILTAFEDNIVFFHSPSDVATRTDLPTERRLRIGGLVKEGSIEKQADGITTAFFVTDTAHDLKVAFTGILPDLFREGQGVVVEGRLQPDGTFRADEVLAKHDETYMPPEVAEAIRKAGQWKGDPSAIAGESRQ